MASKKQLKRRLRRLAQLMSDQDKRHLDELNVALQREQVLREAYDRLDGARARHAEEIDRLKRQVSQLPSASTVAEREARIREHERAHRNRDFEQMKLARDTAIADEKRWREFAEEAAKTHSSEAHKLFLKLTAELDRLRRDHEDHVPATTTGTHLPTITASAAMPFCGAIGPAPQPVTIGQGHSLVQTTRPTCLLPYGHLGDHSWARLCNASYQLGVYSPKLCTYPNGHLGPHSWATDDPPASPDSRGPR